MYQDLEATLHDVFWQSEEDASELPLLEAFLKNTSGTALEVGCGSGRLLFPLLKSGHDIEGLELSSDMLDIAQAEAKRSNLSTILHHGDIRTFTPNKTYNAILIPAFTLQLLSRKDASTTLCKLRQISNDSGTLYMSIFIPWAEITDELEPHTWHLDKKASYEDYVARCYTRHTLNRVEQELYREHRYELCDQSGTIQHKHTSEQTLQWYLLPEITQMLEKSGWRLADWHADFTLGDQDSDASVLTLFARAS